MAKKKPEQEIIEGPYQVESPQTKRQLPAWAKSRAAKVSAISAAGALLLGGAFAAGAVVGHELGDQRAGYSAQFGPGDGDHDRGAFNHAPRPPHGPGDGDGFRAPAPSTVPDATTTNP
ncbi:MAG: hypothetical protein RLY88_125 [Actinomycetota bacterium]